MRLKKKLFSLLLAVSMLALSFSTYAEDNNKSISVDIRFTIGSSTYTVNGIEKTMDTAPTIYHDRTVLPIRYVTNHIGADIAWEPTERKVTVELGNKKIEMWIDNPIAKVDGKSVPIDPNDNKVKPIIIDSRTMLPIRFVAEAMACDVTWNDEKREVKVAKDNVNVVDIFGNTNKKIPIAKSADELGKGHLIGGLKMVDKSQNLLTPTKDDSSLINKIGKLKHDFDVSDPKLKLVGSDWKNSPKDQAISIKSSETVLPIVQRLGRGYNVFGEYASVNSLKNIVLDVDKLVADKKVERIRYDSSKNHETVAESIKKYSKQMSTNAKVSGKYLCFSGSVNTNFSSGRTQETNTYFSTYTYLVKKYGVYIKAGTNLKDYVLPEVRQAINDPNISPETLFNRYGQYILVDTISGGRVDYSISAKADKSTSFENFSLATSADFNVALYGGSMSSSYSSVKNKEQYDSSKDERLSSQGGKMGLSLGQFKNDPQTLQNWEATLEDNGTLVEFGGVGERALIPIWELSDDANRANALKDAFEKMNVSQENQWPTELYVTDIAVVSSNDDNVAHSKCPAGYYLIDANLNRHPVELTAYATLNASEIISGKVKDKVNQHNRDDNYIYLCYQLSEDRENAITDLFVEISPNQLGEETRNFSHNANVANFSRIPNHLARDINYGYLYLWTSRDKTREPLRALDVIPTQPDETYGEWQSVKELNRSKPANINWSSSVKSNIVGKVTPEFITILFQR